MVPNATIGMIIGKGGCYIKQIKDETGAYVQISQKSPDGVLVERVVTIAGLVTVLFYALCVWTLIYSGEFFLKYTELFESKYAGKYVEFGEICGAYVQHICCIFRIYAAYFSAYFWHV